MPSQPPYSIDVPAFPFRALALLAGRAPLGGPRETALATLVAARLTLAAASSSPSAPSATLAAPLRAARAEAARAWMTSVTLPTPVRMALAKLVAVTAGDDARALGPALAKVTEVTAPQLDRAARLELDRLAARLGP